MQNYLQNKKILIGITGGIAAYKSLELIRRLKDHGAQIKTILTDNGKEFVTQLSVHALSGEPVCDSSMQHIDLARWADVLIIAPATANFIAKAAHGIADDLLSTTYLATAADVLIAPAMNVQMWRHHGTQDNLELLRKREVQILGPNSGSQACGDNGPGRMLESQELLELINTHFAPKILANKHIVITAGPTQEQLDPIRYLSNHSSGKMGYALAAAASKLGAQVTLISGPTALDVPAQVKSIQVISAAQMHQAVVETINHRSVDIFIGCAAVADYRPASESAHKIKKSARNLILELEPTTDILATVASLPQPLRPFTVGFAAETENLFANAQSKLESKQLDLMVANLVDNHKVFGQDHNQVLVLGKNFAPKEFTIQRKDCLAYELLAICCECSASYSMQVCDQV